VQADIDRNVEQTEASTISTSVAVTVPESVADAINRETTNEPNVESAETRSEGEIWPAELSITDISAPVCIRVQTVAVDQKILVTGIFSDGTELVIAENASAIEGSSAGCPSVSLECDSFIDEDYVPDDPSDDSDESSNNVEESEDSNTELPDQRDNVDDAQSEMKGRKRKRNIETWKRTVRQKNRERGLAYVNRSGKEMASKEPKLVDCSKCRFECSVNIDGEERNEICKYFYSIDNGRKKDFLCKMVKSSSVDRHRRGQGIRPKTMSCAYYLPTNTGDKRVCQKFFCATLSISKKTVNYAVKHVNDLGHFEAPNLKAGRKPINKTSDEKEVLFEIIEIHFRGWKDTTVEQIHQLLILVLN
jgi:hypothetical protein